MTDAHLLNELPKDTRDYLENILAKDPQWLRPDEEAFLRARQDYLTTEQKRIFAKAIGEEEQEQVKSKSQVKREKAQA